MFHAQCWNGPYSYARRRHQQYDNLHSLVGYTQKLGNLFSSVWPVLPFLLLSGHKPVNLFHIRDNIVDAIEEFDRRQVIADGSMRLSLISQVHNKFYYLVFNFLVVTAVWIQITFKVHKLLK